MDTQNQNPQAAPAPEAAPQPAQPVAPAPAPAPVAPAPQAPAAPQTKEEEDKAANKLCIISLACRYGTPILMVFASILGNLLDAIHIENGDAFVENLIAFPLLCSGLASWILVIVARVKYKQSTFPKVLLIIYIVAAVLKFILALVLIIAFFQVISACAQSY